MGMLQGGNPQAILQNLVNNNPQIGQIMSLLQNSQNPMITLNQISQQNPAMAQALKIAQGKTPQEIQTFIKNMSNQNIK